MKLIPFCICMSLLMISCYQDVIYDQKQDVPTPWKYDNKKDFTYEISDTTIAYDLIISLEHSSGFSFENLYLNTKTIFPDGHATISPVSIQLADDKGDWAGDCDGSKCITDIEMSSDAYFKIPGTYTLSFEQFSRNENLEGIHSIRIKVVKSKT
ncbi:MAG: gliding motility lipoprotein GldH [Saprospiraceae bacterium]|nr:gliding motility lipoprotein GldH [Saprospiraceae bacterium]MBP6446776.1 gliding motility lipoprotein GldH [Saprospiraceae bacterium]